MSRNTIHTVTGTVLLASALGFVTAVQVSSPRGTVIEDFDSGTIELFSYPGEDLDPNGWSLDASVTHNGSPRSLKLTGNTWKVRYIPPHSLDSGEVWSVAVRVADVGEAQGFGIMDSANSLFFSFSGTEQLNTNLWATAYQGTLPLNTWRQFPLPVADEWLTRYGYLPLVTGIVFVNDRDTDPSAIVYFDSIIDITEELPKPPQVSITYSIGPEYRSTAGLRSVNVQFTSHVVDPDSGEHTYYWQFGDNSTSNEAHPLHTFVVEDDHEYTVVLEVCDETNRWGRASVRVAIDPGPTSFPVRLNFVGDVMMARGYEAPGGIIPTQSVQAIFAPTRPHLSGAADITVANLECPLTTSTTAHPTKPIVFKSSPANVAGLVYAGIDVVTIANNHILDYGLAGLEETQNVLRQNGIRYSGAGANAYEACQPLFVSFSGVSFAFLAFSDRTGQYNNYQPYLNAGEDKPGFAMLTTFEVERQISRVQGVADRIVVELHSGREYSSFPNALIHDDESFDPRYLAPTLGERSVRRDILDLGADIVINHHPHIIQGFEVHNGKLIAHSLGNFAFDLGYAETFPSMILNASVDDRGFYQHNVTPVYIDDYIPRRARGQLGLHILDYLAMRSREMGAYLVVHPDSVRASIVLDTTTLMPRFNVTERTLPLAQSGSWRVSKPERLRRNGSLSSIPSITPQSTWQYRLGREVVWFGNCEDEGCTLWQLDASDERFDTTQAHGGRQSLRHRRTSGASIISTSFENRLSTAETTPGFSVYGWIKTDNARDATIRVRFYNSRSGFEIGSGGIGTLVGGTSDWAFYANDIIPPSGTAFIDVFLESRGPASGTGYAWFDDGGLIEWTDWLTYDGIAHTVQPNDFYWLQVRTTGDRPSATVTYREVSYIDLSEPTTVAVQLEAGWNLISNPVARPESLTTVQSLFPASVFGYVFRFEPGTGYVQRAMMENGVGYWGKFPSDGTNIIEGEYITTDTIDVLPGWNIIGSISMVVDTAAIQTIPAGLRSSLFYGYSQGYVPVAEVVPGHAYWMKSADSGMLVLSGGTKRRSRKSARPDDVHTVVFRGSDGASRQLFFGGRLWIPRSMAEIPPKPPEGIMDVRFASNTVYATCDSGESQEWPIQINAASYPVTVSWSRVNGEATLRVENVDYRLEGTGSATIPEPVKSIMLVIGTTRHIPFEFGLHQNYPNPFNPTTLISYQLSAVSVVSLRVYDILGREVATLVNQEMPAGRHSITWDATGVASGIYFCRLHAGGREATRKLLLLH